jgi:hypothetical protein
MDLSTILLFGLIAIIGLGLVVFFLLRTGSSGGEMQERIAVYATVPEYIQQQSSSRTNPRIFRLRRRLNSMLSVLGTDDLNMQLMRADWKITSTEYILIRRLVDFWFALIRISFGDIG